MNLFEKYKEAIDTIDKMLEDNKTLLAAKYHLLKEYPLLIHLADHLVVNKIELPEYYDDGIWISLYDVRDFETYGISIDKEDFELSAEDLEKRFNDLMKRLRSE